jgi:hypothetical protein
MVPRTHGSVTFTNLVLRNDSQAGSHTHSPSPLYCLSSFYMDRGSFSCARVLFASRVGLA